MKAGMIILFIASVALGQDPRERVQFHLKKMEASIQMRQSDSKIKSLQTDAVAAEAEKPRYIPGFGIGDEGMPSPAEATVCTQACDLPRVMTLQEQIRHEADARQVSGLNSEPQSSAADDNAKFIEEFKQNAAKRGVKLHIHPKTLEVQEIR